MSDPDPGSLDPSRYYAVEDHVWVDVERNGTVVVGVVADSCLIRGPVRSYSPRRVGKFLRAGLSCATLEGDDWVAPARSPVAGTVLAVNTAAQETPDLVRSACWDAGWLVRLEPDDLRRDLAGLISGAGARAAFDVFHAELRAPV
jgi:glycine cleavage system H protein